MSDGFWRLSHSSHWLALVLVMAGCSTISVRQESFEENGAEIRGTARYQLHVTGIEQVAAGTMEHISVTSDGAVHICDIERYERTRDIHERRRYMSLVGVHSDYSVGHDLFVDPIMAAMWVITSPLMEAIAIGSFFDDSLPSFAEVNRNLIVGIMGILPLVSVPSPTGVCETITGKERFRRITPATRTTSVESVKLNGTRMSWKIHREDGAELGNGRFKWPAPFIVPWCEWAVNNPTSRSFTLTLASDDCEVFGARALAMPVDVLAAARRYWPDIAKAPTPSLRIESASIIDGDGRETSLVKAGESARIKIVIRNVTTDGSVAYAIRPLAGASPSIIRVSGVGNVDRLSPGQVATVYVEASAPLSAVDGRADVRCSMVDILQRECASVSVPVTVAHADLPHLVVMPATMRRATASPGMYDLDCVIRNAGAAPAFSVKMEVRDLPPGYSMSETAEPIARLGIGEQRRIAIPLRVSDAAGPLSLSIRLTESRGLDPIERRLDVPLMSTGAIPPL